MVGFSIQLRVNIGEPRETVREVDRSSIVAIDPKYCERTSRTYELYRWRSID